MATMMVNLNGACREIKRFERLTLEVYLTFPYSYAKNLAMAFIMTYFDRASRELTNESLPMVPV